jgi:hypothetical protein
MDSPFAGVSRQIRFLLFEDMSPKLNLRPGRQGCLCRTSRPKPFCLGWAYCRRHSSLPCITSQQFTVYFVVDTLLHNCSSDVHPEVVHLNVPEADCPCCSFPQSVQEHVRLINCAKLTSASSFHRLSDSLFTDPSTFDVIQSEMLILSSSKVQQNWLTGG